MLTPGTCFGEAYLVADGPHPLAKHADGSVELFELTRHELIRSKTADPEVHAAAPIVLTGTVFESALRTAIDEREGTAEHHRLVAPSGKRS
jgi:hypothetical protein